MPPKSARPADDEPFDLNLDAVKVEADKLRPFRFHFKSRRWEMTHRELLDQVPIYEAVEQGGDPVATLVLLRAALGDQWTELRKLGLRNKQLEELSKAYDKHCGTGSGE